MSEIHTEYVIPPCPLPEFWRAYRNGWEPGDPMGEGATEEAARSDLVANERWFANRRQPELFDGCAAARECGINQGV